MDTYLKRVEPYILSEDPILQGFALRVLDRIYLATEDTYMKGLEANDRAWHLPYQNTILPYLKSYPLNDKILSLLLKKFKASDKAKADRYFLAGLINQVDPCLMSQYESELLEVLSKHTSLTDYTDLCKDSVDTLFTKFEQTANQLDLAVNYDNQLFYYGQLIVKSLAQKGPVDTHFICRTIEKSKQENHFSYRTIFYTMLAGELQLSETVPDLVFLIKTHPEEDLFIETATEALVKIGTEKVVAELKPLILDEALGFFAVNVLRKIKLELAEAVLLEAFDEAEDIEIKTVLAEGLCEQLSLAAIPKIDAFIEQGFASWITDLVESLYCNCVMNGVDHPKLQEWKNKIEEKKKAQLEHQASLEEAAIKRPSLVSNSKPVVRGERIGRNDPCPCGSGKKYKKCCG